MEQGQLIALNGNIYEYVGFDEHINCHRLSMVEIDEYGMFTATYGICYLTEDEFNCADRNIEFTEDQWYGIVAHFVREGNFNLNEEEMDDATADIVERCFAYGIPKFHELADYIAEYMDR